MLQIHHHIRPDLLTPAAVTSLKRQLPANPSTQFAPFHSCTSLDLPLSGKLSSLFAELAEKNTTYK
jgi:hypothetical protein